MPLGYGLGGFSLGDHRRCRFCRLRAMVVPCTLGSTDEPCITIDRSESLEQSLRTGVARGCHGYPRGGGNWGVGGNGSGVRPSRERASWSNRRHGLVRLGRRSVDFGMGRDPSPWQIVEAVRTELPVVAFYGATGNFAFDENDAPPRWLKLAQPGHGQSRSPNRLSRWETLLDRARGAGGESGSPDREHRPIGISDNVWVGPPPGG